MRVCRRTAALFFPDARLMRQPSPIDVALKVGWSSVFGVGLQQPTFIGSQQEKTDDQQTNAKKTDDQCKICYINWRGLVRWPSAIRLHVSVRRPAILLKVYINIAKVRVIKSNWSYPLSPQSHTPDTTIYGQMLLTFDNLLNDTFDWIKLPLTS